MDGTIYRVLHGFKQQGLNFGKHCVILPWRDWWEFLDCININNILVRISFFSFNPIRSLILLVCTHFSCLCNGDMFQWKEVLRQWGPVGPVFRGFPRPLLSIWWVANKTVLLWFGAVCFAFRGQPILSIQTNGRVIPPGTGEHLKWATKQKPTTYSVLSITKYALQFSFNYSLWVQRVAVSTK